MDALHTLVEFYNHLPLESTYRTVAGGILAHLDQLGEATIYDIAELTASSRTTIWRMVQKMGYDSYAEFRYALRAALGQYTYYNRPIPAERCTGDRETVAAFAQQLRDGAAVLEAWFTPERLQELAALLADAATRDAHALVWLAPVEVASSMDMDPLFRLVQERGAGVVLTADERSRYVPYADELLFAGMHLPENSRLTGLEFGLYAVSECFRRRYIEKRA